MTGVSFDEKHRPARRVDVRHFVARELDVVGQIVGQLHQWKRDHQGRAPASIEISPDVERDVLRELADLRLDPHGEPGHALATLAGVPVHVSVDRAPRGVVFE